MKTSYYETLINGREVQVEYTWSKYYPATFHDPAEGGIEEILAVWADCKNAKGESFHVDIYPYLDDDTTDILWKQLENPQGDD